VASDKRAKESQILPFGFNSEREIILHPAGIMFHIFNIIVIYRLLGLKFALSLAFFLLAIALFILLKPDEEA
tara:strand:- start:387 stop:602 length:216 start_codon:yes stop_codon:yes gene_type:complete